MHNRCSKLVDNKQSIKWGGGVLIIKVNKQSIVYRRGFLMSRDQIIINNFFYY